MSRTFLVNDGRTVTLPQGVSAGPGATNMRLNPGAVVTLEDDKCIAHSRFINGRERAGDWSEIDPKNAPANSTPHVHVASPDASSGERIGLTLGGKPKKEG